MKCILSICLVCLFACAGEPVTYQDGDLQCKGYLALPDGEGTHPAVLVIHEWWGHNDYARQRADQLAKMGYVALAVDMYGDGKTADHPKDAGAYAGMVMSNMDGMKARFNAGKRVLVKHPRVKPGNVAAIGYCFGGAVCLQMARAGEELAGVVSFHGSLSSKVRADKGAVKAKVLVCHGEDDSFIPEADIWALKAEMEDAEADFKFVAYPGAVHGFTNPGATEKGTKFGINLAYNAEADKQSWAEMTRFLKSVFKD